MVALGWVLALVAAARPARRKKRATLKIDTLEHFETFCRKFVVLDNHKPFELEEFQRVILRGYFAGVTETLVLLPKKNGKTTLLAALALYHLIYTPEARCYIAASSKDQARILYDQAVGFLERKDRRTGKLLRQSKLLQTRVLKRKGTKEIRSLRDGGFIRVLSGDVDTGDGVIPTLALVDELHRHKDNGALYGVLMDGLTPDGRIITISTAGESMKSALGRIRRQAYKYGVTREACYAHAVSPNGAFEMHEWALRDEDDREDLELVKQANPLSSMTIARLQKRKESPTMTDPRWARFACGVWMRSEGAAISSIDWAKRGDAGAKPRAGAEVYVGLDIGWKWDCTAAVPAEPHDREDFEKVVKRKRKRFWRWRKVRYGVPRILHPPRNGESLAFEAVVEAILAFRDEDGCVILGVVMDRNADGERLAQHLEDEHDIEVIEHSQDASMMAESSMGFAAAVGQDDLIEHPEDEEFTEHVLAGIAKPAGGEKWRFHAPSKNRGQRKRGVQDGEAHEYVDAGTAAVMVHRIATSPSPVSDKPSKEDYRMDFV